MAENENHTVIRWIGALICGLLISAGTGVTGAIITIYVNGEKITSLGARNVELQKQTETQVMGLKDDIKELRRLSNESAISRDRLDAALTTLLEIKGQLGGLTARVNLNERRITVLETVESLRQTDGMKAPKAQEEHAP